MKVRHWFVLISAMPLAGCATRSMPISAPMHVPEALYQPVFYTVGNGLSPGPLSTRRQRSQIPLDRMLARAQPPKMAARKPVSRRHRKKALTYYGLALNAIYRGRYAGARFLLEQSVRLDPGATRTLSALAQVASKLGDRAGAAKYLKSALALAPENPRLELQAAALDLSRHQPGKALQRLLIARTSPQLKADSPLLPRIYFLLGVALQSRGYYTAAAEAYQQVLSQLRQSPVTYQFNARDRRLKRSRGLIHFLIGRNSLLAGRYRLAAMNFVAARKRGFTNPIIQGQMALAMEWIGHPRQSAADALDYAVQTHGSSPAMIVLADVILNQRGMADVLAAAGHYKAGSKQQATAMACIARGAWITGHTRTARRSWKKLCILDPKNTIAVHNFVVASACTGRRSNALQWVTQQLALHRMPPHILAAITEDFFGLHPRVQQVQRLLERVEYRRLISNRLSPRQQVEQLQWQYGMIDNLALLTDRRRFALSVSGRLLQEAPLFWPTVRARCLALALEHQFPQADALIRKAREADLGGADAMVIQAQVYAAADRMAAAVSTTVRATYRYPRDRGLWRELERLARQRQYPPEEIEVLGHEVQEFPHDRRALFRLVQAEYEYGDLAAFRGQTQAYLSRFPHGKRSLIAVAMVDAVNHDWPGLQMQITRARQLYPTSRLVAVWLALLADSMGHSATGVKTLYRAIRIWPVDADLLQQYADLCSHSGRAGAAFIRARQLARRFPDSQAIEEVYLNVLIQNHLWLQADRLVARWLKKNPRSHSAEVALWRVDFHSHRYLAALAVARKLVHRPVPGIDDFSRLANTWWALKSRPQALNVYRRMLAIEPQNAYANNNLGFEMLQKNQHLRRALAHIQLAIHNYPDMPQYLDSYGWALYKLGFAARAVPYLQRAAVMVGIQHPTVLSHLGYAMAAVGDWQEAVGIWRAAIKAIDAHHRPTSGQKKLLKQLQRKIADEKLRQSLEHLKNSQAM